MQSKATTVDTYLAELPEDRQKAMAELRKVIKKTCLKGLKKEWDMEWQAGACLIHYTRRGIIALLNCRYLLWVLHLKRIL